MHLKRYRRQTVKEALRAVREDLGPDALVLSTRTVTALGVRGLFGAKEIEITAAAERFALSEDRHALTGGRPEMRAGSEIAARFEAGGMDPALAREIAAAHPATRRRGATARDLRATLVAELAPLLLDTAGRSPNDEISREMFRLLAGRSGVRTHLVLSAGTPVAAAQRAFERFEDARPSRLVLTKLDEVESLGPLVSLIRDQGLPVSYFGTGQNVPEDLQRATPPMLAALVMGENAREGAMA